MKRQYLKPYTEIVFVRLNGSVLGDPTLQDPSYVAGGMDAKENNLDFEEGFGDIWADAGDTGNPYDIWGD